MGYHAYIKATSLRDWAVSNRPAVESRAVGSPHGLVQVISDEDIQHTPKLHISLLHSGLFTTRTSAICACFWLFQCQVWWIAMASSTTEPILDIPSAVESGSIHPTGTFLGNMLSSHMDRLYDLTDDIPDVMGLQALRPSSLACKIMTVPDTRCVRVVTPDIHVKTGFHETIIHDKGNEEWPFITLVELGCLRLDWPKELFTFVGRYQCELEQMRKICRERFGSTGSGTCPTCEKYIHVNLGKHFAAYHLDLAQLWRCPVSWCTLWKGTSQDCVDHMRKAHRTPSYVTAGNLARWFPPWTVTREQWLTVNKPTVSGNAVDTFLFSSIVQHHVYDRQGSHAAFRGTYMYRMFDLLKEADAHAVRQVEMSPGTPTNKTNRVARTPRRKARRTSIPRIRGHGGITPVAATRKVTISGASQDRFIDEEAVQALMELALPRFQGRPRPVMFNSPVSPASESDGIRASSPSFHDNVRELSSITADVKVILQDYSVTVLCDSVTSRARRVAVSHHRMTDCR